MNTEQQINSSRRLWRSVISMMLLVVVFLSATTSSLAYEYKGKQYTNVAGSNIYYDSGVSAAELNVSVNYYAQLPLAIRQYLISKGCNIYMVSNSGVSGSDGRAFAPTLSVYSDNKIANADYSDCRIEYYANGRTNDDGTFPHEIAHQLDYFAMINTGYYNKTFCGISNSDEWISLYKAYYTRLLNYDGSTKVNVCVSEHEGYAEAVRILYTNPDALIKISPSIYNYLIEQLTELTGGDCTPPSKVQTTTQTASVENVNTFNYKDYADRYADLKAAFGYNQQALYNHYVTCGKAEGRIAYFNNTSQTSSTVPQTMEHFDYVTYANTYPDLYAAFGYNQKALYNHYVNYGKAEGRIAYFK